MQISSAGFEADPTIRISRLQGHAMNVAAAYVGSHTHKLTELVTVSVCIQAAVTRMQTFVVKV